MHLLYTSHMGQSKHHEEYSQCKRDYRPGRFSYRNRNTERFATKAPKIWNLSAFIMGYFVLPSISSFGSEPLILRSLPITSCSPVFLAYNLPGHNSIWTSLYWFIRWMMHRTKVVTPALFLKSGTLFDLSKWAGYLFAYFKPQIRFSSPSINLTLKVFCF